MTSQALLDRLLPGTTPSVGRSLIVSVAGPAGVAALALLPDQVGVTTAALAFVLAVAISAALGGIGPGLLASALSFAALHYFFTPPRGFGLPHTQDLVALLAFLVVSGLIGAWLSAALAQRARVERQVEEARLLHRFVRRLLAGESLSSVLQDVARSASELIGLARVEIAAELTDPAVYVAAGYEHHNPVAVETFTMTPRGRRIGQIRATPTGTSSMSGDARAAMQALATQIGLALDAAELAAEVSRAELEVRSNKALTALFSSVTHDLRTPLASILASASSLRDAPAMLVSADRRELLDAICQEAERLNRLVGNLLELSRMRAGALTPTTVFTPVEELVEGVLARLAPVVRDHPVLVSFDRNLPDAQIDVVQIDQVVTNLVENAAKFAPAGAQIRITGTQSGTSVLVRTEDDGPGISPEDRERAFEPFVRGRRSEGTGSGLGLAICKAIVEAHGGRIWIDEPAGHGMAVTFALPIGGPT